MLKTGVVVQITLTQHCPTFYNMRFDDEYRTYSPQGKITLDGVEVGIIDVCKALISDDLVTAEFEVIEDSYVEVIDVNFRTSG